MCALGQAREQDGAAAEPGPRQLHHQQRLHWVQLRWHLPGKMDFLVPDLGRLLLQIFSIVIEFSVLP